MPAPVYGVQEVWFCSLPLSDDVLWKPCPQNYRRLALHAYGESIMKAKLSDKEIEQRIRDAFELNYEMLRLEGGHAITPDGKQLALNQVLYYWRKLRDVAEKVTD